MCKNATHVILNMQSNMKDLKSQLENFTMANYNYRGVFAFLYKELFSSPFGSIYNNNEWEIYNIEKEFDRQGVSSIRKWRYSKANQKYQLCTSYPTLLCVPNIVSDKDISYASEFRAKERIPVLTYMYKNNHVICRASQPKVGLKFMNRRSIEDELLVNAIKDSSPNNSSLIVFDARPKVNAIANQAKGAGYEDVYNAYVDCEVKFLNIDNMHAVRNSFNSLRDLCCSYFNSASTKSHSNNNLTSISASLLNQQNIQLNAQNNLSSPMKNSEKIVKNLMNFDSKASEMSSFWFTCLMNTRWLDHLQLILRGSVKIAKAIYAKDKSVLVHCSNGWLFFPLPLLSSSPFYF